MDLNLAASHHHPCEKMQEEQDSVNACVTPGVICPMQEDNRGSVKLEGYLREYTW